LLRLFRKTQQQAATNSQLYLTIVAPATAPAERAATLAFVTISGVMAAAIVPHTGEGTVKNLRLKENKDPNLRPEDFRGVGTRDFGSMLTTCH
jgi:hypothetical protein